MSVKGVKMNLRKLALISVFTMAPLNGAMAAASGYSCLAGPQIVKVALAQVVQREDFTQVSGSFAVAADDYGMALAKPVTAFLSLVAVGNAKTLVLEVRNGEQRQTRYSADVEMTPNIATPIALKSGQISKVSIECKTDAQWAFEAINTEGKIQASMGQD
jgi:hypothetical protein